MMQEYMLYLYPVILGALHAFEPGHGKTIIAAYMIGTRGRAIDGVLLGGIVTFTHTFSVIILGIIARAMSGSFTDEQLHGWFGLVSAVLILVVGIWMLRQRLSGANGHHHFHLFGHKDHNHHNHDDHHMHDSHGHEEYSHHHNHDNDSPPHSHSHEEYRHSHGTDHASSPLGACDKPKASESDRPRFRQLLVLGVSGGLVPCPAAIAALLVAIAAGRVAEALTIALLFSLGLGLVMVTIGVVLSHAGKLAQRMDTSNELSRRMGLASAVIITILGAVTLMHSIRTLWLR